MTDYTYDDFDDAAECILGAAEDLAAAEAVDDEIPVDAQEIRGDDDEDNASVYSTETEASDPTMALFRDINNDIDPLDGTGLLREKCGGTFDKVTSKSTKQKRNAVLRQWAAFVAGAPEDGLDPSAPFFLTEVEGEVTKDPNFPFIHRFGSFYIDNYCNGSATQSQWNKFLDAVQNWTDENLLANNFEVSKGVIRSNHYLKCVTRSIVSEAKKKSAIENTDLQVNLLRRTTKSQELNFIQEAMVPSTEATIEIDELTRMQAAVAFGIGHCTLQRGQFARGLKYKFGAVRILEGLGPKGTKCEILITNDGKTNTNGHIEAKALPPHRNPQRDVSAILGMLLMWRHQLDREPFPSFLSFDSKDLNSYCNRFILRSSSHWNKGVTPDVLGKAWNRINIAVGIFVEKLSHAPRISKTEYLYDESIPGMFAKMVICLFVLLIFSFV